MSNPSITCRFSVNSWQHLYSLHQAVRHAEDASANRLIIEGVIRNEPQLDRRDTPIRLVFAQSATPPYRRTTDNRIILGTLLRGETLSADIPVDAHVLAELKKNLAEYMSIDGIHVMITIGLNLPEQGWQKGMAADIVQLDYAMKGDGG
ncbi:MAG: hypothetical protein QG652_287 [Pseudomonadota bacterium]|nr:hypothetical protein [Pseudomonadota bacterium]